MKSPLTEYQLEKLNEHVYAATGRSLIEPIFQVFWNWLIKHCPLWFAPNAMTLSGLILNVFSVIFMLFQSPDALHEISPFLLVFACACLFLYQTLDALDGKQARRTNSSSPLGELFDHGCDSFSTVFVALGTCVACGLGTHPVLMFTEIIVSVALFYMAQWQCYVTGSLRFGKLDVTEAQTAIMIIYLLTAVFGLEFWSRKLPILGLEYKEVQFLIMFLPAIVMFIRFFSIIMRGGGGKNGATIANTSVVFPIFPLGLVVFLAIAIAVRSPTQLYRNHPCLYLTSFGLVSSKITNKLIVAHMTKSEINLLDTVLLGPLTLFLNQYFHCPLDEKWLLWSCCIWATWDGVKYTVCVCSQIADYLNLFIFRTNRPSTSVGHSKIK